MAHNNNIVTAEWLKAHIDDSDLRIFDATFHIPATGRDANTEFDDGHIPGAQCFDLGVIADPDAALPHTVPSAEIFQTHLRRLGVNQHDHVIVYDDSVFMSSARAWWLCRLFGHTKVSYLDGGLTAWKQAGGNLEKGASTAVALGNFIAGKARDSAVAYMPDLRAQVEAGTAGQIVDARATGRFTGEVPEPRAGIRSGHIPGSLNVPVTSLFDPDTKLLKPTNELKQIIESAGVDLSQDITTTCGTGVTACALALALELVGHRQVAMFDGSWTEWGTSDAPIETGTA
ncbi:3-mercaptopyruvate sulfurtransferase [Candidatus Puniceispirillum marinum]|uniref:Sulfurtransferase n=1 Tax=Puniceispirillum marinum (strain IMCC1322) TaxID=488538 RepID=D5BQX6_PUNMI|nr:3-mercaptopyruvate sulfurtransferase [Candidatus Puniceispirillum marinum]ADE38690.1 thiosulfate sulfurtransferase [Candidatus Puniceispirillum marinum IMCC1322]